MTPTQPTFRTSNSRRNWIALAIVPAMLVGCETLPGTRTQQSTTVGAVAGAAIGGVIAGEGNRIAGALIGAAIGGGGGYLLGAHTGWFGKDDARVEALDAVSQAQHAPATAAQARAAATADINADGFVTYDEMTAMQAAGFSDEQMLQRLRSTGQVFDLNVSQKRALRSAGISAHVVDEMQRINAADRNRVLSNG